MWSCDWEAIRNHQMQPLQLFKLDKIVPTLEILTVVKNVEQNWKHIWQLGDRGRKAAKEDRDLKKFISSEMAHRDEVFIRYSSKSNIQYSYHPTLNFPYVSTTQPILDYLKCSLDRLKNSFFILIGAFMIKAEMCELLLSLLKVFWSIKVGHKQHLCEIMKPWCGRDFAASKLSTLRILIKYKLLSERQIYTKFSWSSCCASLTFENCKTLPHFMHGSVSLSRVEKYFVANF